MPSTAAQITPSHPELRVIEGGRAPAALARRAVYRRRQIVAAVVLIATLLLVAAAVARIAGDPSPTSPSSPTSAAAPSAAGVAAPPTVIVEPGDTLWSIAAEVAPGVDVRVVVDRLVALNGTAPIVPGQQLEVPAG